MLYNIIVNISTMIKDHFILFNKSISNYSLKPKRRKKNIKVEIRNMASNIDIIRNTISLTPFHNLLLHLVNLMGLLLHHFLFLSLDKTMAPVVIGCWRLQPHIHEEEGESRSISLKPLLPSPPPLK